MSSLPFFWVFVRCTTFARLDFGILILLEEEGSASVRIGDFFWWAEFLIGLKLRGGNVRNWDSLIWNFLIATAQLFDSLFTAPERKVLRSEGPEKQNSCST